MDYTVLQLRSQITNNWRVSFCYQVRALLSISLHDALFHGFSLGGTSLPQSSRNLPCSGRAEWKYRDALTAVLNKLLRANLSLAEALFLKKPVQN
jgi:hypothetical protein